MESGFLSLKKLWDQSGVRILKCVKHVGVERTLNFLYLQLHWSEVWIFLISWIYRRGADSDQIGFRTNSDDSTVRTNSSLNIKRVHAVFTNLRFLFVHVWFDDKKPHGEKTLPNK